MNESAKARTVSTEETAPPPIITHAHTPPFVWPANVESSTRGHDEKRLSTNIAYCTKCGEKKPKGGWSHACSGDRRRFNGGR